MRGRTAVNAAHTIVPEPPGVVDAREWRPDWEQAVHLSPRDGQVIVGVARVG